MSTERDPDAPDLAAVLDGTRYSAFRLETLPSYGDAGPDDLRSISKNPYLRRIAASTLAGAVWTLVRVLDDPLTDYQREQLGQGYIEAHAVGLDVRVIRRADVVPDVTDWWLVDPGSWARARAVLLHFDDAGVPVRDELVTDPDRIAEMAADAADLTEASIPLNDYLRNGWPRRGG